MVATIDEGCAVHSWQELYLGVIDYNSSSQGEGEFLT